MRKAPKLVQKLPLATRREVVHGWREAADSLINQGQVLAEKPSERTTSRMRVQKELPTR